MSVFGNIVRNIFQHPKAQADAKAPAPAATSTAPPAPSTGNGQASSPPGNVDVSAVLGEMAQAKDGGGNYKVSIVDLLNLLDMDSSLAARKELATELNVHAGADGSAEQNVALHKAVMHKLSENGGIVPADWMD